MESNRKWVKTEREKERQMLCRDVGLVEKAEGKGDLVSSGRQLSVEEKGGREFGG